VPGEDVIAYVRDARRDERRWVSIPLLSGGLLIPEEKKATKQLADSQFNAQRWSSALRAKGMK
jgi:hypothetical protein